MPRVSIGRIELYFERAGNGSAVLCVPGALGTGSSDFGNQLRTWSRELTVIAPDPNGYGQSRPPERDFSIDFYQQDARDMAQLMDELGYGSYSIAGFSDGANVAVLLAASFPQKVSKLVIWGGNSFYDKADLERIERTRLISNWPTRLRQSLEAKYGPSLQPLWSAYCDGIRNRFEGAPNVCRRELCFVRCPTLVLHGGSDPVVTPQHARIFRDEIKDSRLHILVDGHHSIHQSHAEEFNKLVLGFLLE